MDLINSAHVDVRLGLVLRGGGWRKASLTVRYGLIDRGGEGLCLIDTGYGSAVTTGERSPALRLYNRLLAPRLIAGALPMAALATRGASAGDVRTIVLTHLHADHVACLRDFPDATILAWGAAVRAALASSERQAYRHGIFKELLPLDLASRITAVEEMPKRPTGTVLGDGYDLFGDESHLAVPLPGHAFGHFGIFRRGPAGPILYAVDATWTRAAMVEDRMAGIAARLVFDDYHAARATLRVLRAFIGAGGGVDLCHDIEGPG